MTDDIELINSPLSQAYSADGHTLHIDIYRSADENRWSLEVEDEDGTSTAWSEQFETDKAALEAALSEIEKEGIANFIAQSKQAAKEAEPELLRKLEALKSSIPPEQQYDMMSGRLSKKELAELDHFLLYLDAEESMTLDMLDGFLHALAIGPETVMPNQWLPRVWGQQEDGDTIPPTDDPVQMNRLLDLVIRHYNSIVFGFEMKPPFVNPLWNTTTYGDLGEFDDAEMWAYGFCQAVQLNPAAWQRLLNDPLSAGWYQPIGLLGADDFSPDKNQLIRMPDQRHALAMQIPDSLRQIHAFWLPLRGTVTTVHQPAQRISTKVGRNEPCPCGSGKKFKKCCDAPPQLH
jgi:uncharacterized protein